MDKPDMEGVSNLSETMWLVNQSSESAVKRIMNLLKLLYPIPRFTHCIHQLQGKKNNSRLTMIILYISQQYQSGGPLAILPQVLKDPYAENMAEHLLMNH